MGQYFSFLFLFFKKTLYKCIKANSSAIRQHVLHIPPTKVLMHLLTAQKTQNKSQTKDPTFRNMEVYGKRGQENGAKAEKDKTERAKGLGRRTREEI